MLRHYLSLFLCLTCLGGIARAHPHVFVDASTGFIFDAEGDLSALRISWTYDEFTTLVLFETLNLDQDGDGQLSDADRRMIIDGETNWEADYKGDVYFEVAGRNYPLGRPEAAAVAFKDNQIEISFDLPLSHSLEIGRTPTLLRLYDPYFYYAYTILPAADPIDLPEGCQALVVPFEPNAVEQELQEKLAALGREETPDQENVGRLFSDEVRLTCG